MPLANKGGDVSGRDMLDAYPLSERCSVPNNRPNTGTRTKRVLAETIR
jgi:hypothetical protein